MACQNCGAELAANERFCRSCGAGAQGAAPPNAPSAEDAWATPVGGGPAPGPAPRQGGGRPGWLVPALVVVAALIAAAVAGVVLLGGGGSDPVPLTEQAAPVLAPVAADLAELSGQLKAAKAKPALARAKVSALKLAEEAGSAAASVRALELADADETAERLLAASLDATKEYASRVAEAAGDPRKSAIDEVGTAAESASSSFAALAAAVPELKVPDGGAFAVVVLRSSGGARNPAARAYVTKLDSALTRSARTRGSLGDLIDGVGNGSIPADESAAEAQGIVDQRNQLATVVAAIDTPPAFVRASGLLVDSLQAAVTDDRAIQDWVLAKASGDDAAAAAAWTRHLAATARATAAKGAFVAAYDAARKSQLRLGPLPVGDKY